MDNSTPSGDTGPAGEPGTSAAGLGSQASAPPGSRFPLLPGVRSRLVQTPRLRVHLYESGPEQAPIIVLVHGNASSARFFEELMVAPALAAYRIVAPDLRGYGASEAKPADATRGLRDYSDDVHSLVQTLEFNRFHLLGWSLGGNIAMQYTIDHPENVRTLTLQSPGSPFGFGGSHGADGQPNYEDFAGSGGGLISPEVVARYVAKDDTADSPFSPRNGLRQVIVKPTFQFTTERENILVEQMLMMVIGDEFYPGDKLASPNWPFFGPGVYGSNNGLSPKYPNQRALADLRGGPPVVWIRGADDQLVSDTSLGDPAALGMLGIIPGWPGADVCPPQPMVTQVRAVLDRYAANGGRYEEVIVADCGHGPHIEHPDEFLAHFTRHLRGGDSGGNDSPADVLSPASPDAPTDSVAGPHPQPPSGGSSMTDEMRAAPPRGSAVADTAASGDVQPTGGPPPRRRSLWGRLFGRR